MSNSTRYKKTPVLREDGRSLDWGIAAYGAKVDPHPSSVDVVNTLSSAPELNKLISDGSAVWVLEIRCPGTQFIATHESENAAFSASWTPSDVDGDVFLLPGLVATRSLLLPTSGLISLWGDSDIRVPAGSWLAKAKTRRAESLASSMLIIDVERSYGDGQMSVEPLFGDGTLKFLVKLSPRLHERRTHRDIQVAALIGAFGRLPEIMQRDDGEMSKLAIVRELKLRLHAAGVSDWEDDNYDPARAATAVEEFRDAYCPENSE